MKIDARAASDVDVLDESGRKIGTATIEGERIVATISDEAAAAAIVAQPRWFSLGCKVMVAAIPSEQVIGETDEATVMP